MCRLGPICIEICEAAPAPVGPQFPCGSPLGILRVDPGLGVPISIPRSHFQPLWSCGSPYNSPRADPALPLLPFHIFSFDKYVSSFRKIVCSRRDLLCKEWLRSYSCPLLSTYYSLWSYRASAIHPPSTCLPVPWTICISSLRCVHCCLQRHCQCLRMPSYSTSCSYWFLRHEVHFRPLSPFYSLLSLSLWTRMSIKTKNSVWKKNWKILPGLKWHFLPNPVSSMLTKRRQNNNNSND